MEAEMPCERCFLNERRKKEMGREELFFGGEGRMQETFAVAKEERLWQFLLLA